MTARVVPLFLALFVSLAGAQELGLISFEIKDQFDQVHTDEDYLGSIVVVIGSDKGGAQFNGPWGRAIGDLPKGEVEFERVKFLPLADRRGHGREIEDSKLMSIVEKLKVLMSRGVS